MCLLVFTNVFTIVFINVFTIVETLAKEEESCKNFHYSLQEFCGKTHLNELLRFSIDS